MGRLLGSRTFSCTFFQKLDISITLKLASFVPFQRAPQQENGYDCGIFACQTLEHRGRGLGDKGNGAVIEQAWEFEQDHIPGIRRMMVHEIKSSELLPRGSRVLE